MTDTAAVVAEDRLLARRIATLMRWGTLTASVLLIAGALLAWADLTPASSLVVIAGCATLVLLPLIRLLLMLTDFARRADTSYVLITVLVIFLLLVTVTTGLFM